MAGTPIDQMPALLAEKLVAQDLQDSLDLLPGNLAVLFRAGD